LKVRLLFFLLLSLPLLAACAQSRAISGPEGRLTILDPIGAPDNSWILNDASADQFGIEPMFGKNALFLINGENGYSLVRRTKATLLSSPYLSWEWYLRPFLGDSHPVRILVGFHGGARESGSWGSQFFSNLSASFPPHDRLLSIGWAFSQQSSNRLVVKKSHAAYTAGSGVIGLNKWRAETVDLVSLYAQAWPEDDRTHIEVMFIGLAVEGGQPATRGHIATLQLTR